MKKNAIFVQNWEFFIKIGEITCSLQNDVLKGWQKQRKKNREDLLQLEDMYLVYLSYEVRPTDDGSIMEKIEKIVGKITKINPILLHCFSK